MPRPTVPAVADAWYRELSTTQPGDEARDWPLLRLLGAAGTAFGRLHDVVRDTDQGLGWSSLLDADRCPGWALPWLAQFAGVKLTSGLTEAQQRAQITAPPAFQRGTRAGMMAVVSATLTGTKTVRVAENVGTDPYRIMVVTSPAETPDAAAARGAALSQKPIGMLLDAYVSSAPLLAEYTRPLSAVTVTLASATLVDVT